jgi:hypothetical protein
MKLLKVSLLMLCASYNCAVAQHASPTAFHARSPEEIAADALEDYNARKGEIQKTISSLSLGTKADYHHGVTKGEKDAHEAEDGAVAIANFRQCQTSYNIATPDQKGMVMANNFNNIAWPPKVVPYITASPICGIESSFNGMSCGKCKRCFPIKSAAKRAALETLTVHPVIQLARKAAIAAALAVYYDTEGFACSIFCESTDLVEYSYPTMRVEVGEQIGESRYMTKDFVEAGIKANLEYDKANAFSNIMASLALVEKKVQQQEEGGLLDLDAINDLTNFENVTIGGSSLTGKLPLDDPKAAVVKRTLQAISTYRNKYPNHLYLAPSAEKGYGRVFVDDLNVISSIFNPFFLYASPHLAGSPPGGIMALDLGAGYAYGAFAPISNMFGFAWAKFMAPDGEKSCLRNNAASGKVPFNIAAQLGIIPAPDITGMCLKDIGEVVPLKADRRPHLTDGAFQGAAKIMLLYKYFSSPGGMSQAIISKIKNFNFTSLPQTYSEEIDKWLPVYPKAFYQESPLCLPLQQLARKNTTFRKANLKDPQKGGVATFQIYTTFKGCWGYKGQTESDWSSLGGGLAQGFIVDACQLGNKNGKLRVQ